MPKGQCGSCVAAAAADDDDIDGCVYIYDMMWIMWRLQMLVMLSAAASAAIVASAAAIRRRYRRRRIAVVVSPLSYRGRRSRTMIGTADSSAMIKSYLCCILAHDAQSERRV